MPPSPTPARPDLGLTHKLSWIAVLYFAQGLPFGVAYKAWPVYFRIHGVSLAEIGAMSLLFLPYTLKAAWAPLVDRFGSRQRWIVAMLAALAGVTLAIAALDPGRVTPLLWGVLLAFTLASATQDVAIDAWAVDVARGRDRGPINSVRVATYRTAMVVGGGALVIVGDALGWGRAWGLLALLLAALALAVAASPRVPRERPAGRAAAGPRLRRWRVVLALAAAGALAGAAAAGWSAPSVGLAAILAACALAAWLDPAVLAWLGRREMVPLLAFTLLYKLGDSTLSRMVEPFWLDRGLSATEVGLVATTLGTLLVIAGAALGGWYIQRRGIFPALVWFGLAQAASNFGYVAVAVLGLPRGSIYLASAVESLCQGLGTAAFLSFLMALCDREHGATQFALLTATFAVARDLVGAFSGVGAEALGYGGWFTLTALLALPGLALLPVIRDRVPDG